MSHQPLTEVPEQATQQVLHRSPNMTPARFSGTAIDSPLLQLQRSLGNRRIAELIQTKRLAPDGGIIRLQPKLTVGAADDQYEREADHVAREVISMPDPMSSNSMQRAVSSEENKDQMLQTKSLATPITPFVQRQLDPHKIYCALHAAVCLGLSENPPAAALCWANFAARCGGAMASAGQPGRNDTMESGSPTVATSESEV